MDAFFKVGVRVQELTEYLGHPVDTVQPAEIVELRSIYNAIRDGETTWLEVMENRPERGAASMPHSNVPSPADDKAEKPKDEIDALLADVAAANDMKALDALMGRVRKVSPSHPRRGEIGPAIDARRKAVTQK
jgi:ribonuclease D